MATYRPFALLLLSTGILGQADAIAATLFLPPVADASLLEIATSNSMGGFFGMNSGTTQEYYRTRSLILFDLTAIPQSAIVLSTSLHIEVTRQPSADESPPPVTFGLHRMLRPWGEGTNSPTSQFGKGLPASEGDATWLCTFFPTNLWNSPGGAPGTDFSDTESTFTDIIGVNSYTFPSTPELVADLKLWMANPQINFGWMLLCNSEAANFTARRFATREDADHQPFLEIQYLVPPRLAITRTNSTQVAIQFTAWAGHYYDLQYCNPAASPSWQLLTHLDTTSTNRTIQFLDTASATDRVYRVNCY